MTARNHNQRGATMGVVIVCCIILVLVVVGLFHMTMIFGGSQELRNSVDAGTLNVGKEAVKLKVTPGAGAESEFADVCDTHGQIGLTNINRVLAKSFLLSANAQAMEAEGMSSGDTSNHANQAADAAQSICNNVTTLLKDHSKKKPFFDEFIKVNSVKMFGKADVKAENSEWDTACVDRDDESNLRIDKDQLPSSYTLPPDATKSITEKGQASPTLFLKGYHGIPVHNRVASFVPFKYDEKPHLINGFYFTASKVAVPQWTNPVPNALSTKGGTDKLQINNTASAFVVTNPQRQYQAAMPHSFIHIRLEENEAVWKYQGAITDKTTHYGYYPGQVQTHVRDAGSGTMNITATLGLQYADANLDRAINPVYAGENTKIMKAILQRVREIKHDFTMDQLHSVLKTALTIGVDSGDFYIFPTYSKADNTDPEIHAAQQAAAHAMAPWIQDNAADGSEKEDYDTDGKNFIPFVPTPNVVIMTMSGIGCKPGPFGASESGHLNWRPGTGYGQCLGKLTVKRTTKIYYSGLCTIL